MRRFALVMGLLLTLVAVAGFGQRVQAAEPCKTQGALALALAQLLGYDVTTPEAAVSALERVGIAPLAGWKPGECLTGAVAAQVDQAVRTAVAAGLVPADLGDGAVASALEAIGAGDLVAALGLGTPVSPLAAGPAIGGGPARRHYREPPPPPPPPPPVSPFRPQP